MVNYSQGKIYKIVSSQTNKVYVGATCKRQLCERMAEHRLHYKQFISGKRKTMYTSKELLQYGDAEIVLLENCHCNTKDELNAREQHYVNTLPNVVNKNNPVGLTVHEHYLKRADKMKEIYRQQREIICEKRKKHYEKNKDRINEQRRGEDRIDINCECGLTYRKSHKHRHYKTTIHKKQMEQKQIV